jgi:hypothetical protein
VNAPRRIPRSRRLHAVGDPEPADNGDPIDADFDITVVDGEAGRQLAILQAQTIMEVLTWLHEHHSAHQPTRRAA